MGRPLGEEYKGGIYHVMVRENNKKYIFKEGIDHILTQIHLPLVEYFKKTHHYR